MFILLGANAQQVYDPYYKKPNYIVTSNLTDEEKMKLAGIEMQKYYKNHNTGIILSLLGSGSLILGKNLIKKNSKESPYYRSQGIMFSVVGGISALAGTIMLIEAPLHIKNAGLILSGGGVGLTVKF
jgi:hypothetical protein